MSAAVLAAYHGHLDTLKSLVKDQGQPIQGKMFGYHETALVAAARCGQLEAVQWLLAEGGASINEVNGSGQTAVLEAARNGQFETLRWLIKEGGASAVDRDSSQNTPLLLAAAKKSGLAVASKIARWLIEEGGSSPAETNNLHDTALLLAVQSVNWELVDWLLEEGWAHVDEDDVYLAFILRQEGRGQWLAARQRLFSVGWNVRNHHKFPRRFRVLFCGLALWCLGIRRRIEKENAAEMQTSPVLPAELIGLMFCFWHGEIFAPTQNW
eukprot:TRINITY_DN67614_c2_g2_i1.p1 TRINITY_DN67614_c2_g2~~TRINITY_DN67614_c2_g2_i1.p1  ORF type:complete len:268 (+),score=43.20 TRINITY_DN67614_c2_g2_i1:77-880(+)